MTKRRKAAAVPACKIPWQKRMKRYRMLYLMLLPGVLWFMLFHIIPLGGIVIAFEKFNVVDGIFGSPFVGLENFKSFLNSATFSATLTHTLTISILKLVLGFPLPIIFALCLNEIRAARFKKTVQTISYLPFFLSWVIVMGISSVIFNPYTGVLSKICEVLGANYVDPTTNPNTFVAFLVLSYVWKSVGWNSIIYLACLSGVDQEIYEAAYIDGAGRWRRLLHVTIPAIKPIIAIQLILSMGSLLTSDFEQIYLFTGSQNYNPMLVAVADTFDTWIYRNGIAMGQFSNAAALGIFQSLFGACLILITNWISKKLGNEGIW
jgi:putative aldouronate transport system permease protein